MKKRIYVDFDDTLVDLAGQVVEGYNKIYGKNLQIQDMRSANSEENFDLSEEGLFEMYSQMEERGLWKSYTLLPDAKDTILSFPNHSWNILTAREKKDQYEITETLQREGLAFESIYGVRRHDDAKAKAEIALEGRADLVIEDNPFFASECAKAGLQTLVLERPWNETLQESNNLIKVPNWKELRKYLR